MGTLQNEVTPILFNEEAGAGIWLMRVTAPYIASTGKPGQFIHARIPGMDEHMLRRPFGIYAQDPNEQTIDIMYQVLGFGTEHMTTLKPGDSLELIGPVGRPWQPPQGCKRALLVAGGVGSAPLFPLAQQLTCDGVDVVAILGAQTAEALVAKERFCEALGGDPRCSTDDGSFGYKGFCTPLVEEAITEAEEAGAPFDYIACCGPEPLMKLVANLTANTQAYCEVSLEKRMACGIGVCLSCVVDTIHGKRRACVDGPVFPAKEVIW